MTLEQKTYNYAYHNCSTILISLLRFSFSFFGVCIADKTYDDLVVDFVDIRC